MPGSTAVPNILVEPGYLYWAPLASTLPTNTVVGSKFTDAWPGAWLSLGATKEGGSFKWGTTVAQIRVAELPDPIRHATTDRSGSISAALADITLTNFKRAMNGGTLTVVSGTGATTLSKLEPPALGSEVRAMIGWENVDNDLRLVCYQCFQGGEIDLAFRKAPDNAVIPVQFNLEVPTSGIPWSKWAAGTARG